METLENLHNLHFERTEFFSEKWKYKSMKRRQIYFDTTAQETWFMLNAGNLDLFIYFADFGTKQDPQLLNVGKLPKTHKEAVKTLADLELKAISLVDSLSREKLKEIDSSEKMKTALDFVE